MIVDTLAIGRRPTLNLLYPKLSVHGAGRLVTVALVGAVVGGLYGALHDQISYSISPEYFTKMKFHQFAYANFGWPERVFASEVGVLASWWVGMISGWILGRVGYDFVPAEDATKCVLKAFAILVGVAVISGVVGILLGVYQLSDNGVADWQDWSDDLRLDHVREFAIVAYLHGASYLGAVLGLGAAVVYLVRCRRKQQNIRFYLQE